MKNITALHEKALMIVQKYHQAEYELIDILQKLDQEKIFLHMGFSSLFDYAVRALKLSEANAYNFITVMRKAKIIPELKLAIEQRGLTVSKARKITPVITRENSPRWIELAQTLPQNKLEQAVAKESPKTLTPERAKYITETRLELKLGISESVLKKLKRAQNILSQKIKKAASFEDTIYEALSFYLEKQDPLEKAKRNINKNSIVNTNRTSAANPGITNTPQPVLRQAFVKNPIIATAKITTTNNKLIPRQATHRQTIPVQTKHQIILRDQNRCTYTNNQNERCKSERWLEIHHKQPVAKGGENTIENLTTLCANHHKQKHL